ncbi:hypothetical protein BGW80DRAFT_1456305 [Lactifluus volemus]|nr:hypothetical protein BGW80DRAFT_1456305 [Lactifluus volemus]
MSELVKISTLLVELVACQLFGLVATCLPYAAFYPGLYADWIWTPLLILDVTSGKVSVGGDGDTQISFTSRLDIARYVSYVLTHLPVEQLENHSFRLAGDIKSFNEIFRAYEAKTGKKLEVTYIPVSELEARLASDPQDFAAFLHKMLATTGPVSKSDNHLYPDWNPSSVLDNIPVA